MMEEAEYGGAGLTGFSMLPFLGNAGPPSAVASGQVRARQIAS